MKSKEILGEDSFAELIHTNFRVLEVFDRMGVKLGVSNKSIEEIAVINNIDVGAFLLILNVFCDEIYSPTEEVRFEYIKDILRFLMQSHSYFLEEKIPLTHSKIKIFVDSVQDSNSGLVEEFYNNYIEEVTEHIEYENEIVFPYILKLYKAYSSSQPLETYSDYKIDTYNDRHHDIEDVLLDLKNILIRHLPQVEKGKARKIVLQQLFELEADLKSHTRIEDEILIPLVKKLENEMLNQIKIEL